MPGQGENVILLRVQLDESDSEKRLAALVLDIEKTRQAQIALNTQRKAGQVADADYAKQVVDLKTQLKGQLVEQSSLSKNLDLYRTAVNDTGGSYKGLQAQLSLAQNQFKQLDGSADNSSAHAQALSKTIDDLRNTLLKTDETQSLFVRNLGNYPKPQALEPLIQQFVLLQEQLKLLPAGSAAAVEGTNRVEAGFKQLGREAAAQGKTLGDVENLLKGYGEAIRPAEAELAKLTIAQDEVAKSAGKESIAFSEIGFKINQTQKAIVAVPVELAKVPTSAETATRALSDTFQKAANSTGLYGDSIGKAQKFIGQFKSGLDLLKGGFKGVQAGEEAATEGSKVLKIGLAEIGIGLLILAFTSLVSFFTQSAEGAKILGGVTSALGATFQALTDIVTGTGKAVFQVLSGDFKGAGETVGKTFDGIGQKIADAAVQGYKVVAMEKELAKSRRQLEVDEIKEQSRVNVLLRLSKERGKTSEEQLTALKQAGEIEAEITQKNIDQQQKELDLINLKIKLKGSASKGDLLQQQADAQKGIEQSLATQKETNAKIQVRQSVFLEEQRQRRLDDNKAYYDAAAAQAVAGTQAELNARVQVLVAQRTKELGAIGLTENQKQAIIANSQKAIQELQRSFAYTTLQQVAVLEQQALDARLVKVKIGSEEELGLLRQKLVVQRNLELQAVGLTLAAQQAIQNKFYADAQKLEVEAIKTRALMAYDAELSSVNAELTLVQKGTQQELELRENAIRSQLAKDLAALDARGQNEQKAALLRANAEKAINDTRYVTAQASLEKYLQGERNALDESFAKNQISEQAYNKAVLTSDVTTTAARLQLAKDFKQDTTAQEQQLTAAKIAGIKAVGDAERTEQAKRIAQAQSLAESLTSLFAETVATTGATLENFTRKALVLLIDSLEKSVIATQIEIISKSFAAPDSILTGGLTGIARAAGIIALVVAATETLKAKLQPTPQQFAQGTVLGGASHAQGGVQLYSQAGHHFGEAEKDEVILTKGVWQNPLLRPLASQLNVLGGGKPLTGLPRPHMALGGVAQPLVLGQLKGNAPIPIDYDRLARAMTKVNVKATISDVKAGLDRDAATQRLSNS